jgi:hypothetical protein
VQSTLGVGGCGNICFGHVLVAARQGQRRGAAATGKEQLGRCTARKSKYTRFSVQWQVNPRGDVPSTSCVDGRSFSAGGPALTHLCTVGACGTRPGRGPPAALPGVGVWHGAMTRIALRSPTRPWRVLPPRFVPQPNGKQQNFAGHQLDSSGVDSRFETARSSSAFNFCALAVPETWEHTTHHRHRIPQFLRSA